jgi:hypothetical protein
MGNKRKKKWLPIKKDWQGRWMYNEKSILVVLKKMKPERQVKILNKALTIATKKHFSKVHSIASALDCRYEDADYYSRAKKIRA